MARARFTLDDAALELLQLEADDLTGARRLRDRLRRLAGKAGDVEAALLHDAAAALDAHGRGAAPAGVDLITDAGHAIEQAMNARDQVEDVTTAAHTQVPAATNRAPAPPAVDPLMLAALAALEADDAAAAAAAAAVALPMPEETEPTLSNAERSLAEAADAELLEGFVAESEEYLRDAEMALLALERDPSDMEAVNRVFRCFHTIKGTSAFLGLEPVSKLAHRAESLLSRARDGEIRLTGTFADLSLQAIDVLNALVRGAIGGGAIPEAYDVVMAALSGSDAEPSQPAPKASPAPVPAAARTEPDANGESYTRVRTDRLDQMLDIIGEMVIAHAMIAEDGLMTSGSQEKLTRKVAHAGKIVRELQDLSISMRMVPMKALFQKLARVCRDCARKSGKTVDFLTDGEDTEIDRNMVDVVGDPLIHMVRNAVDHGIETPDVRRNARKPARGLVRLRAYHAGGSVVLTLEDDGHGLDHERLVAKAVAKGLIDPDRTLSEREVHELIFAPGFSTAEQVTDLSGRGVGMDVVRRNIESLRGRIEIDSQPGRGSTFTIRLPLTLAITDGMMVRVGAERYIVPNVSIQMSFRPDRSALSTVIGRGELVSLRGEILPIVRLHRVLEIADAVQDPAQALLVIVGSAERRCALLVDELLGQYQVVAKSLGAGIGKIPGISGGAILGDGRVGLILDVPELLALPRVAAREKVA
jgi:two-component system chemotaxis sensor kinase CheA